MFGFKQLQSHLSLFRIFAPKCAACGDGITPVEGTEETVRVVAMEKDFHVDCYVCEVGCSLMYIKLILRNDTIGRAYNHLHPKRNHPCKFQLLKPSSFGGVWE